MGANLQFLNEALIGDDKRVHYADEPLNVTGSNAHDILGCLGFDTDFDNSDPIDINEFIEAAALFLNSEMADIVDNEREPIQDGRFYEGGRRKGYLKSKILLILGYARLAKEMGATHAYFI
jgi:hypothetical protein